MTMVIATKTKFLGYQVDRMPKDLLPCFSPMNAETKSDTNVTYVSEENQLD